MEFEEIPALGLFSLQVDNNRDTCDLGESTLATKDETPKSFSLHLFPWKGATWPGSDVKVSSDSSQTLANKLQSDYFALNVHRDLEMRSWLPCLNLELPTAESLLSVPDCTAQSQSQDLLSLLKSIERTGRFDTLVKQLENVLQKAVQKRVYNLPRANKTCGCNDQCKIHCTGSSTSTESRLDADRNRYNTTTASGADSNGSDTFFITKNQSDDTTVIDSVEQGSRRLGEFKTHCDIRLRERSAEESFRRKVDSNAHHDHSVDWDQNRSDELLRCIPATDCLSSTLSEKSGLALTNLLDPQMKQTQVEHSDEDVERSREKFHGKHPAKVAVLFSGGIDSTVLAAFADRCVPKDESIDLINVAFEKKTTAVQGNTKRKGFVENAENGLSAYDVPDRVTGYSALAELNPHRHWNFVEVNVTQTMLQHERSQFIRHLVYPLKTVLDDSIGCAVWFAARGEGVLGNGPHKGTKCTSKARVILCGMGADEQLAGYSRHRVRFKQESWQGLLAEINMEIRRISARNLGRDDRVITDHGKESRFPFLDEDVVGFLSSLPIHCKADLRLERGLGEKLLLRLLALKLGLPITATLPKRAIQFGSRIAKLEESKEKGAQACQRLMQE